MPRLKEELQFPVLSDVIKPKTGFSLYNDNGVLTILHADGTSEVVATGNLDDIEINVNLEDYYTRTEVDNLLSALGPTGFEVVILETSELPKTGESGKLYLLPNGDTYTEYLYVSKKWEMIGSTNIDLSKYALAADIPKYTSQLTNDEGYIKQDTVEEYTYSKSEIESLLRNAGGKATFRTWTEV